MSNSILRELPELVTKNVITEEVAQNIRNHYSQNQDDNSNRLFVIFGILGALLGGLGIILILAHNWDDFSVTAKTVFSFLPLILGQAACLFSLVKKNESPTWRESSSTFLFFSIAATISLIAQVYNINGNFNAFLLTWMLLALPLVYIMRSSFVSLLYIAGITYYCSNSNYFNYPRVHNYYYWGLLLLIFPYYFSLIKNQFNSNFTNFHHWFVALSIIICLSSISPAENSILIIGFASLFGLYYFIGKMALFSNQTAFRNPYHLVAKVGLLYLLFFLTFKTIWEHIDYNSGLFYQFDSILYLILLAAALFLWIKNAQKTVVLKQNPIAFSFLAISLLYLMNMYINTNIIVTITNLYLLLIGVYEITEGAKSNSLFKLNFGLIIITILITCRFFDTEMSFVVRGLLFIGIGIGFFLLNYYLLKKRRQHEK